MQISRLMPCPFTGCKMFCASPNFLCPTKNLFTYCASHKDFVPDKICQTKFAFSKIGFCAGTKVFEESLNSVKFLGWFKKFGPAQNILQPVKGQGIRIITKIMFLGTRKLFFTTKKNRVAQNELSDVNKMISIIAEVWAISPCSKLTKNSTTRFGHFGNVSHFGLSYVG